MVLSNSDLNSLPKVELHLHLDCSLDIDAVRQLGNKISDEEFLATFTAPEKCASLRQYLDAIAPSCDLLQSEAALEMAATCLALRLAGENVLHAEVRFAPHLHTRGGLSIEGVVEAVLRGFAAGAKRGGASVAALLCVLREHDSPTGLEVVRLAQTYREHGVAGIDLAGDEAGYPLDAHVPVFRRAAELGLRRTAHAGEAMGPQSVIDAITLLNVERIGHGVRSIEDGRAIELIKARDVHLEICPTSNIQVGVFPAMEHHPVDQLSKMGVSLSINTDARTVNPTSLTREYAHLAVAFGWNEDDFQAHTIEAINRAFLTEPSRKRLLAQFLERWDAVRRHRLKLVQPN